MKILLVAPTVDTCYEYVLPVGLMNLHSIARRLGCEVDFLDLSRLGYGLGLEKALAKEYDLIGISCNFTNAAPYCMRYAADIKKKYPRTMVIAGGNHATLVPEDLLLNSYDFVIYGEAELTFEEFVSRLLAGKPVKDILGLYYLENGALIKNKPRGLIEDLDSLPWINYAAFDLKPYFKWANARYLNIETSRGCLYDCSFCATVKMWGRRFRHKSPERIVKEFKQAKELGCEFVFLCDDDTALSEENLRNFCAGLIREGAPVPWGTTIGSKSIKDSSTYRLMAQSGCIKVNVCIESANDRILKECRKPHLVRDNLRACGELTRNGILVHNHGIIGFPGESPVEILRTYFYLMLTSPIWHVTILEPRPGSDYWQDWDKKGEVGQYRLFGKANALISQKKVILYLAYYFFALFYFLNPQRIFRSVFSRNRTIRMNYAVQYRIAAKIIKENLCIVFEKIRGCFA